MAQKPFISTVFQKRFDYDFNPDYAVETSRKPLSLHSRHIYKIIDPPIRWAQQFCKHPLSTSIDATYCLLLHNPGLSNLNKASSITIWNNSYL